MSKVVVITGSTKGIGFGMAEAFLAQGCSVVVSGRAQESVESAIGTLAEKFDQNKILGHACDVTDYSQVQALWQGAADRFGRVDIWVNNAGQGQAMINFWEIDAERIRSVVEANLLGQMYGVKVAVTGMLAQGGGALYIMEGKGSDGKVMKKFTLYSATKRATNYLFDAMVKELENTPVIVGSLSPGMVITGLFDAQKKADPENWEQTKKILNIIGEKVEVVSPWLVERMLGNNQSGKNFRFLTGPKVMWRFLSAPFSKRDLFSED